MWIVGVLLLIAVAGAVVAVLSRSPRSGMTLLPWDIPGPTGPFTGVVGTLAGFSVASAIFIANLSLATSAMIYSSTPNAAPFGEYDPDTAAQQLSHLLGNTSYFLGLAVGWLSLPPLLEALRLPALADAFVWLLLVVLVVGSGRLTLLICRLTAVTAPAYLAVPLVGIALPAHYRGVAANAAPWLWPVPNAALLLALVAFGVAAVGFGLQSGLAAGLRQRTGPGTPRAGWAPGRPGLRRGGRHCRRPGRGQRVAEDNRHVLGLRKTTTMDDTVNLAYRIEHHRGQTPLRPMNGKVGA